MPNEVILVVEDFDLLRSGLEEILNEEGYTVVTARNGKEALDVFSIIQPNLIVSDVTMPIMDGFEFFNAVRAQPEGMLIPFIFLTARDAPADVMEGRALGADDYLVKPIHREDLISIIRIRLNRFNQAQMARLQQAYLDSLVTLANAIENRNPDSQWHIERITDLCTSIAQQLGWNERRISQLRMGCTLHDIGKITIPAAILFKSGPLTDLEWKEIRRHPVTGGEMIKDVPYLTDCIPIVRHHHERWDGKGYPDELSGNAIPEGARLLAVVDSFVALISYRPYAPARTAQQALDEIVSLGGDNYDPRMVLALMDAWKADKIQAILQKTYL
jgi:putative two-component system response regulator